MIYLHHTSPLQPRNDLMIFVNITKCLITGILITIGYSAAMEQEMNLLSSKTGYGATQKYSPSETSNNDNRTNDQPMSQEDYKKKKDERMNTMRRDAQEALELRAIAVKKDLDDKTKQLYKTNSIKCDSKLITGKEELEIEIVKLTLKYKSLEVYLHAKEDAQWTSWSCFKC